MSEHNYWNRVRDLVESGYDSGLPKADISEQIVHMVQSAEADGEQWAYDTLTRWAKSGADADYTKTFKDMNTVTFIRRDGRKVRKTVAYSRPQRSEADGEIVGRQMQAWWGMSRAAIAELRAEMADQRDRLSDVVKLLDALLEAMDRHPECATAAEAWQADGHSLDEIEIGEVAA